jgi:hypothetical protein
MKGILPEEKIQTLREKTWPDREGLSAAAVAANPPKMQGIDNPGNPDCTRVTPGSRHRRVGRAGCRSEDSDPAGSGTEVLSWEAG